MEKNQNQDRNQNNGKQPNQANVNDSSRNNNSDKKNPTNTNDAIVNREDSNLDKGKNPVGSTSGKQNERAFDKNTDDKNTLNDKFNTNEGHSADRLKERDRAIREESSSFDNITDRKENATDRNYKSETPGINSRTDAPVGEKNNSIEDSNDEDLTDDDNEGIKGRDEERWDTEQDPDKNRL